MQCSDNADTEISLRHSIFCERSYLVFAPFALFHVHTYLMEDHGGMYWITETLVRIIGSATVRLNNVCCASNDLQPI